MNSAIALLEKAQAAGKCELENESGNEIRLNTCPWCGHTGSFSVNISGSKHDGLFNCHYAGCNASGNLKQLATKLGIPLMGLPAPTGVRKPRDPKAPIVFSYEQLLAMQDEMLCDDEPDSLTDYLLNVRKYTLPVIQREMLGLQRGHRGFTCAGKWHTADAWVIPFLGVNNLCEFTQFKVFHALDRAKKIRPHMRGKKPLYNARILSKDAYTVNTDATTHDWVGRDGGQDLLVCEGPSDCLAALSAGVEAVAVIDAGHCDPVHVRMIAESGAARVILALDADGAGRNGTRKWIRALGRHRVIPYTISGLLERHSCKDVNEFTIRHGNDALRELVRTGNDWKPTRVETGPLETDSGIDRDGIATVVGEASEASVANK